MGGKGIFLKNLFISDLKGETSLESRDLIPPSKNLTSYHGGMVGLEIPQRKQVKPAFPVCS
jgi:hypothetical protein